MNASRTGRRGADDGGVTGAGRGRAATKASPRSETRADSSSLTGTQGLTNARTRLVGQRTGPVADAIVVAVKVLRAVRRGSTALWRGASSVVTPLGWTVLLLVPIGLAGGRLLGWVELLTIGLAALVMIALAALFLIGRTAVDIDLVVPHERVSVGEPASGEVRVANPTRRRVLGVTVEIPVGDALVEVGLPGLRSGDAVAESFPVPTGRRGVVRIGPARTVRGDAVGLVRRELEWATVTELFVHPATIGIPSTSTGLIRDLEGSPTRDLAPDDLSFHALREYQPGDERRNIHWKSTAKAGAYMVRQFDASRRSHLVIALSLATSDFATDEEFELAVSAAGSLGARAIRDAREVSVVVSERTPDFAKRKTLAVRALSTITRNRLLDDLAVVERAESALVITDVARVARDRVAGISVAFLVVGSTTSLAEMRGAALQFPLGVEVVAIVCDPEAVPGLRRVADLTVLTIGYLDDLQKSLSRVAAS